MIKDVLGDNPGAVHTSLVYSGIATDNEMFNRFVGGRRRLTVLPKKSLMTVCKDFACAS